MSFDRDPSSSPRLRRFRHVRALLTIAVAFVLEPGCSEPIPPPVVVISRKIVKVEEVPAPILKAAKRALPGVKFEESWRNVDKDGTAISFELRGTTSAGKIRDVRVGVNGAILETE